MAPRRLNFAASPTDLVHVPRPASSTDTALAYADSRQAHHPTANRNKLASAKSHSGKVGFHIRRIELRAELGWCVWERNEVSADSPAADISSSSHRPVDTRAFWPEAVGTPFGSRQGPSAARRRNRPR